MERDEERAGVLYGKVLFGVSGEMGECGSDWGEGGMNLFEYTNGESCQYYR